jgi:manganese/iron transport system permease protein
MARVPKMDYFDTYVVEPLQYPFMIRALIVSICIGVMCPVIGSFVITRGLSFMGDALAHSVMPGIVIAYIVGINVWFSALPSAIGVALLIGLIVRRTGIREDTTIGIIFAGMFAFGLVLIKSIGGIPIKIEDILLGQLIGVSQSDTYVTLGLAIGVILVLFLFYKELVFTSFDPVGATIAGIRQGRIDTLLLTILSIVIVISIQAAGVVLVMGMLITPAATAYLIVQKFKSMMIIGSILGVSSTVAGLYLSFHFNLPSGPTMTLVATALFTLAASTRRRLV